MLRRIFPPNDSAFCTFAPRTRRLKERLGAEVVLVLVDIETIMNLASVAGEAGTNMLFVNFNQDCSSLAVGTKSGYRLFSLNSVEKLDQIYESEGEDICIVERLFSSSLVAVVSLSAPRKLKICHFKKGTEICNYSYSNTILAVKLNRLRLIVCLEESLYVHNIRDMKVLHTIRDTPPNPQGLCALSVSNDNCFLAYPGSSQIGEVQVFDTVNLRAVTMIPAHDNKLASMEFDSTGTRLATASEKGTVVRVFSIPEGQKLHEFRRGVKRCVSIYSLAFSGDGQYLAASSNTETVHVFRLEMSGRGSNAQDGRRQSAAAAQQAAAADGTDGSWMGYLGNALVKSANYLPTGVSEMLSQGRDFATVRLPFFGCKTICAVATIHKVPRVLVASADGWLYVYNLDPVEGAECALVKQYTIDGAQAKDSAAVPSNSANYAGAIAGARQQTPLESQAYCDPEGDAALPASSKLDTQTPSLVGAVGSSVDAPASAARAISGLRLDDEQEFPPMAHRSET